MYNENGVIVKDFTCFSKKAFTLKESIYNNERLVLRKEARNWETGLQTNEVKFSYNPMGMLKSTTGVDRTEFSYDEDGKLIKELNNFDNWSSTTDYFYTNGKLDSSSYNSINDGKNYYQRKDIFGEDNKTQKMYNYSFTSTGDRFLKYTINFLNDEKGNIIEEMNDEFDSKGNKIKSTTTKYEYNYDEDGNWIQKRTIEEGKLKFTENRTIVYKGGEINMYVNEMENLCFAVHAADEEHI